MQQDEEHLRLLSIFHYVAGGLAAFFGCFPILQLLMGIGFILASREGDGGRNLPPPFVGGIFVAVASVSMIVCLSIASCMIATGRFLGKRKHYTFCLATAGIECVFMPFGTVLGVFTIIVLIRESVKKMFSTG